MIFYRRRLPHWHPEGAWLFLTWRLYGSLPESPKDEDRKGMTAGQRFRSIDTLLDRAVTGPLWLKNPRVANYVVAEFCRSDRVSEQYQLDAFVVMANHVHILILPKVSVRKVTNDLKGVTARKANAILGRTGRPFWQDESFDQWVRSENQFQRIRAYIEKNSVSAGLAKKPEDWPWSSANPQWRSLQAARS